MEQFTQELRQDWHTSLPFVVLYMATTFMDVITGLAVAFQRKRLCSTISRDGIMRKVIMTGTVMLAAMFDGVLPEIDLAVMGLSLHMTFAAVGSVWWMLQELLSITENAAILGLWLPKRLKQALLIVQEAIDKEDAPATAPQPPLANTTGHDEV